MAEDANRQSNVESVNDDPITRRQILAMTGGAAAASLAGCGGNGGNGGGGNGGGSGGATEPKLDLVSTLPLGEWEPMNPVDTGTGEVWTDPVVTWHGIDYFDPDHQFLPELLTKNELSEDGTTWTIKIDDRFTWHDGTQVNAYDKFYLDGYFRETQQASSGSFTLFDDVNVVYDYTIEYTLGDPSRPGLFFADREPTFTWDRSITKPWYERAVDASTQQEVNELNNRYTNEVQVSLSDYNGHGMWQVDNVADTSVEYTKYEDHPYADKQNVETVEVHFAGSESAQRLMWRNDTLDLGAPPRGTTLSSDQTMVRFPTYEGYKFYLNRQNPHLAKRGVRRAIAHLINSQSIVSNVGEDALEPQGGFAIKAQHGMPTPVAEDFLGDEIQSFRDKLIDYGFPGSNISGAEEEMRNAGYSKNSSGKWEDSDGNVVSLHLYTEDWINQQQQTIASQLRSFGFEAELTFASNFWDNFLNNTQPENHLITSDHGPDETNSVAACYDNSWNGLRLVDERETGHYLDLPWEVEIPETIGDTSGSGSMQTINLREIRNEMADPATSDERYDEIGKTLAWYWNYDVPAVYYIDTAAGWVYDSANFDMPDIINNGHPGAGQWTRLLGWHSGRFTAKTQ